MRRFSDRLVSATLSVPAERSVGVDSIPDEALSGAQKGNATSRAEGEYTHLVQILGLHQTVQILESEYRTLSGADNHAPDNNNNIANGYVVDTIQLT